MSDDALDALLAEQIRYYRSRAPEYDAWFLREGRFDLGPEAKRAWLAEVELLRQALAAAGLRGHVLELACGTGWWTEALLAHASRITAVDASPEAIALNRARLARLAGTAPGAVPVEYVEADLFRWRAPQRYDGVFFGFWLSHVPPARFERFWQTVDAALAPGGRVFFVDSLAHPEHEARNQPVASSQPAGLAGAAEAARVRRVLGDGRAFDIVKVFHAPAELARRLAELGWTIEVAATPRYFLYASGQRTRDTAA